MRLERIKMIGIVDINEMLSLKWRCYGPKGDIFYYWGMTTFWFIILLYPTKGNVYKLKQWIWEKSSGTMVSVENSILVSMVVFIAQDKILW